MLKWICWEIPRRKVFTYVFFVLLMPQLVGYFIVFPLFGTVFTPGTMIALYIIQDMVFYLTGEFQEENDRT